MHNMLNAQLLLTTTKKMGYIWITPLANAAFLTAIWLVLN